MGSYQRQYKEILDRLIKQPDKITSSRNGNVRSRFFETITIDMKMEFPLMDVKKLKVSNIVNELKWFLSGNTNIKFLRDGGCYIWDDDAYRYYNEKYVPMGLPNISKERFLELVDSGGCVLDKFGCYRYGDMDKIYGFNWNSFNGQTNQILNIVKTLKTDVNSRRMVVTAFNPTDIENNEVGLPACHNFFQFYVTPGDNGVNYLSLHFNMRSNDVFLGNPYNIASYGMLLYLIAKKVDMIPDKLCCSLIDCHLYEEHLDAALEWCDRYERENPIERYCMAQIEIVDDDIIIKNYYPEPYIKAKLLT